MQRSVVLRSILWYYAQLLLRLRQQEEDMVKLQREKEYVEIGSSRSSSLICVHLGS